jgi:hypothetical protein
MPDEPSPVENLGQVLFGERIRPSNYKVYIQFQLFIKYEFYFSSLIFLKVMTVI